MAEETHFQGGTNTRIRFAKGASGSNVTVTGLATTDVIKVVQTIEFDADGDIYSIIDYTDDASITAADTLNLSGVTTTADKLVYVQYVDVPS